MLRVHLVHSQISQVSPSAARGNLSLSCSHSLANPRLPSYSHFCVLIRVHYRVQCVTAEDQSCYICLCFCSRFQGNKNSKSGVVKFLLWLKTWSVLPNATSRQVDFHGKVACQPGFQYANQKDRASGNKIASQVTPASLNPSL